MAAINFPNELINQKKKYYLGLDLGSASVGYAVTDLDYKVIKKSGKSLWGVRLFKEGAVKSERRAFRSARRRYKREKQRIAFIKECFSEEIGKVDPGFYQRLQDSTFHIDDKSVMQKYSLFNDPDFTDADYHKKYPTIFHLRKDLMERTDKMDIRLIYLAIHQLMKNRGHFLTNHDISIDSIDLKKQLREFRTAFIEYFSEDIWDQTDETVEVLLLNKSLKLRERSSSLKSLQTMQGGLSKSSQDKFSDLICGKKVSMIELFPELELTNADLGQIKSVCFRDESFVGDEYQTALSLLDDECKDLLLKAYDVYSNAALCQILTTSSGRRHQTISDVYIERFEKHKSDLKLLKSILRNLDLPAKQTAEIYHNIFKRNESGLNNYTAYTRHVGSSKALMARACTQIEVCDYILKQLRGKDKEFYKLRNGSAVSLEAYEQVLKDLAQGELLPKSRGIHNSYYPHQIHQAELERILENASKHYEFLNKDTRDKIIQVFAFRRPYYVGPVDTRSPYSWVVRKDNNKQRLMPWNMADVIDLEATAEAFVKRLTATCSYLYGEDVLPKNSLIYSEFAVRNELNQITVELDDGKFRLEADALQTLYEDLFLDPKSSGRVTKKKIAAALQAQGMDVQAKQIGGLNEDIKTNLKSHRDLNRILGSSLSLMEREEIIQKLTAFPDDQKLIFDWLEHRFSGELDAKQIEALSYLKYEGWGRLSKKFLTGIKYHDEMGVSHSILDLMKSHGQNLMEIVYDKKYSLIEEIRKYNQQKTVNPNRIEDDDIEDMYISPSAKKSLRQALKMCKEIFAIMGGAPEKIFIEMARGEREQRKTLLESGVVRKEKLKSLYKQKQVDDRLWKEELEDLNEGSFKSKRRYLYALQQGVCMYTGEVIDFDSLCKGDYSYDIDHIYPYSKSRDESLDNLVLVKQEVNKSKSDKYPLDPSIQNRMRDKWRQLRNHGFISNEKYQRLIRTTALTTEELTGFINRQIVDTRQSTLALTELMKRISPMSETIYVKAGLVSDFRYREGTDRGGNRTTHFYFPKIREANDYHHAKDAYLNIVAGNVYHEKFTKHFYERMGEKDSLWETETEYRWNNIYDREIMDRNQRIIWKPEQDGSIEVVSKQMSRNDILLVWETRKKSGGFFAQNALKKIPKNNPTPSAVPIKTTTSAWANLHKYGYWSTISISHFCLIKYRRGRQYKIKLVGIPMYVASSNAKFDLQGYIEKQYDKVQILKDVIRIGSIIEKNGICYIIKGYNDVNRIYYMVPYQGHYDVEFEMQLKMIMRYRAGKPSAKKVFENDENTLQSIYDRLTKKLGSPPFSDYSEYQKLAESMNAKRAAFQTLDCDSKINIINKQLEALKPTGVGVNVNGSNIGKFLSTNFKTSDKIVIHHKSATGFYTYKEILN